MFGNFLELLRLNGESKDKLKNLLTDNAMHSPIDEDKYTVIYVGVLMMSMNMYSVVFSVILVFY